MSETKEHEKPSEKELNEPELSNWLMEQSFSVTYKDAHQT